MLLEHSYKIKIKLFNLILGENMSRHYEDAEGLYENIDEETQSYVFNQTMLRIKDPKISLDFYTRIIGMKLYRQLDFPDMIIYIIFSSYAKRCK